MTRNRRTFKLPEDRKELLDRVANVCHRKSPDNTNQVIEQLEQDVRELAFVVMVLLHPSGVL